jgi:diaminopimelate epimerase
MAQELPFTKMQGIGNDFVVADCLLEGAPSADALQSASVRLCDRKFGVGGDGVLLVLTSDQADFTMRMFNPDSSESEMCGNGIRCFAKYVYDRGYTDKKTITVETGAGVLTLDLSVGDGNKVSQVTVDMGRPHLTRAEIPMAGGDPSAQVVGEEVEVAGRRLALTAVSMGNPHAVFFAEPATDALINEVGPLLEVHPLFPRRTNVHAVEVLGPAEIKMLTWERGAGRTLACGTGACGSVVASALNGKTGRRVLAHLPGGDLTIHWSEEDGHVYMTGPAAEVFTGTIALDGP